MAALVLHKNQTKKGKRYKRIQDDALLDTGVMHYGIICLYQVDADLLKSMDMISYASQRESFRVWSMSWQ